MPPRSAGNSPATKSTNLPTLGEPRPSALPSDLSKSSILAIHRPIAARRRTESGEPGEVQGANGMYVSQTADGELNEEGQVPDEKDEMLAEAKGRPLPPSRSETANTGKSMGRRLKLAEKLMDVFGLDEVEDVVAGALHLLSSITKVSKLSDDAVFSQNSLAGYSDPFYYKGTFTSQLVTSASTHIFLNEK